MVDRPERPPDAPFTGQFVFAVDGVDIGAFTEVSGLAVEVAVEELEEGGQNHFVHKLPGRMSWPPLVLKRGIANSDGLFDWFAETSGDGFAGQSNRLRRREGEVVLVDAASKPLRRWQFVDAFPVRWTGPTFVAGSADVAVEELEIVHHGFRSSA
jgi:phage tail-like protein